MSLFCTSSYIFLLVWERNIFTGLHEKDGRCKYLRVLFLCFDVVNFQQEWYVDRISVERNEKIYACCAEPYPDVTFTIHMTRRSLFYIINLIFPCLLIYAVSFLGFFLPVESGEKVNLEITILLALVVFLLIVGETLPPTPDAIPALGEC